MSQPLLLCPQCHHLLLQPIQSALLGHCSVCGWYGLPQFLIVLPHPPVLPQKGILHGRMGNLWLADLKQLLVFSLYKNEWQSISLPNVWSLKGIAFSAGVVLLSPGEENTLGEPKPFTALNPETGQILWQVESEGIQWTAPVADETIACAVDSRGQVVVVHPDTGQSCWDHSISLGNFPRFGIPPVLSASYILLSTPSGELLWLSRRNGKEAGRFLPPIGGLDFPPACIEDVAYFCVGEGLYHLDLHSNEVKKIFRSPRKSSKGWFFASPLITPQGLLVLYADFTKEGKSAYALQLLDPETGQALWPHCLIIHRHPQFAPACENGRVYLTDRDGHLLILDLVNGETLAPLSLGKEEPGVVAT